MYRWVKLFFILLLGTLSVATAQTPGARTGKPGGPPPAMPVETAKVETGTVTRDISAVGTLRANESVILRSEIAGRITDIHFSEGQTAEQGAELVSLDAAEHQAQLAETAATLKLDQLNYQRAQDLVGKKLLSRQSYDEAAAKLAGSRAAKALQEARLDKTKIRAPFAGVLGLRQVSPGDYVQPGQDIVNLEDISTLKLDFRVPETYVADVKQGQSVTLQVDAYPEQTFSGTLYAIDPRIDEQTRTLLLRARVPNPAGQLRPGMFARVNVVLESRANAVLIPEQALVPIGDQRFVYRVIDGKAVQTPVQIGQRRDGKVEISAGLAPGDTLVVAGQAKLRDGMPVTPLVQQSPPPAARK